MNYITFIGENKKILSEITKDENIYLLDYIYNLHLNYNINLNNFLRNCIILTLENSGGEVYLRGENPYFNIVLNYINKNHMNALASKIIGIVVDINEKLSISDIGKLDFVFTEGYLYPYCSNHKCIQIIIEILNLILIELRNPNLSNLMMIFKTETRKYSPDDEKHIIYIVLFIRSLIPTLISKLCKNNKNKRYPVWMHNIFLLSDILKEIFSGNDQQLMTEVSKHMSSRNLDSSSLERSLNNNVRKKRKFDLNLSTIPEKDDNSKDKSKDVSKDNSRNTKDTSSTNSSNGNKESVRRNSSKDLIIKDVTDRISSSLKNEEEKINDELSTESPYVEMFSEDERTLTETITTQSTLGLESSGGSPISNFLTKRKQSITNESEFLHGSDSYKDNKREELDLLESNFDINSIKAESGISAEKVPEDFQQHIKEKYNKRNVGTILAQPANSVEAIPEDFQHPEIKKKYIKRNGEMILEQDGVSEDFQHPNYNPNNRRNGEMISEHPEIKKKYSRRNPGSILSEPSISVEAILDDLSNPVKNNRIRGYIPDTPRVVLKKTVEEQGGVSSEAVPDDFYHPNFKRMIPSMVNGKLVLTQANDNKELTTEELLKREEDEIKRQLEDIISKPIMDTINKEFILNEVPNRNHKNAKNGKKYDISFDDDETINRNLTNEEHELGVEYINPDKKKSKLEVEHINPDKKETNKKDKLHIEKDKLGVEYINPDKKETNKKSFQKHRVHSEVTKTLLDTETPLAHRRKLSNHSSNEPLKEELIKISEHSSEKGTDTSIPSDQHILPEFHSEHSIGSTSSKSKKNTKNILTTRRSEDNTIHSDNFFGKNIKIEIENEGELLIKETKTSDDKETKSSLDKDDKFKRNSSKETKSKRNSKKNKLSVEKDNKSDKSGKSKHNSSKETKLDINRDNKSSRNNSEKNSSKSSRNNSEKNSKSSRNNSEKNSKSSRNNSEPMSDRKTSDLEKFKMKHSKSDKSSIDKSLKTKNSVDDMGVKHKKKENITDITSKKIKAVEDKLKINDMKEDELKRKSKLESFFKWDSLKNNIKKLKGRSNSDPELNKKNVKNDRKINNGSSSDGEIMDYTSDSSFELASPMMQKKKSVKDKKNKKDKKSKSKSDKSDKSSGNTDSKSTSKHSKKSKRIKEFVTPIIKRKNKKTNEDLISDSSPDKSSSLYSDINNSSERRSNNLKRSNKDFSLGISREQVLNMKSFNNNTDIEQVSSRRGILKRRETISSSLSSNKHNINSEDESTKHYPSEVSRYENIKYIDDEGVKEEDEGIKQYKLKMHNRRNDPEQSTIHYPSEASEFPKKKYATSGKSEYDQTEDEDIKQYNLYMKNKRNDPEQSNIHYPSEVSEFPKKKYATSGKSEYEKSEEDIITSKFKKQQSDDDSIKHFKLTMANRKGDNSDDNIHYPSEASEYRTVQRNRLQQSDDDSIKHFKLTMAKKQNSENDSTKHYPSEVTGYNSRDASDKPQHSGASPQDSNCDSKDIAINYTSRDQTEDNIAILTQNNSRDQTEDIVINQTENIDLTNTIVNSNTKSHETKNRLEQIFQEATENSATVHSSSIDDNYKESNNVNEVLYSINRRLVQNAGKRISGENINNGSNNLKRISSEKVPSRTNEVNSERPSLKRMSSGRIASKINKKFGKEKDNYKENSAYISEVYSQNDTRKILLRRNTFSELTLVNKSSERLSEDVYQYLFEYFNEKLEYNNDSENEIYYPSKIKNSKLMFHRVTENVYVQMILICRPYILNMFPEEFHELIQKLFEGKYIVPKHRFQNKYRIYTSLKLLNIVDKQTVLKNEIINNKIISKTSSGKELRKLRSDGSGKELRKDIALDILYKIVDENSNDFVLKTTTYELHILNTLITIPLNDFYFLLISTCSYSNRTRLFSETNIILCHIIKKYIRQNIERTELNYTQLLIILKFISHQFDLNKNKRNKKIIKRVIVKLNSYWQNDKVDYTLFHKILTAEEIELVYEIFDKT